MTRPGALRRAVAELERIVGEGPRPDPVGSLGTRLAELASAPVLATLFRLALVSAVRRGPREPEDGPSPARLLAAAAAAAAGGRLAVPGLIALRETLAGLEEELHDRGAWDRVVPLWWRPLPAPGPLEIAWDEIERSVRGALGDGSAGGADGWLHLPAALPAALLAALQDRLEDAVEHGVLALAPGGVGASAERSRHRSDAVAFLTGLEPPVLAAAPELAVLVQWLLARAAGRLGRDLLPGRELFTPQTAMLARYRPPASGFDPHIDNPGGANDNGRALTAVFYLGLPGATCAGGELLVWPPHAPPDREPAARLAAVGGSAVLFDARRIPHAVRPLAPGPDRWTLVVWLNESSRRPPDEVLEAPRLGLGDALRGVDEPPVSPGRVLFRQVDGAAAGMEVAVRAVPAGPPPRVGVVATVGPDSSGAALEGWARHHLDLGADHLLLVLDDPDGTGDRPGARRRLESLGGGAVTVWSAGEARRRWPPAARPGAAHEGPGDLRRLAGGGSAAWAVAARQGLNATAALGAARGDELGGRPLDWLVHLDADELLVLDGEGRGGATLADHFAAARAAGLVALRYANHELLLPWEPGAPLRFKANPLVASARLGSVGWEKLVALLGLAQSGPRPYFRAYWNGKAAVAVAAAEGASGVHGWRVAGPSAGGLLAGPSILHVHLASAAAFRAKYLRLAQAADGERPFPPSPLEESACALIRRLRAEGAPAASVERDLDALYATSCCFAPREIELLEAAGLLTAPELGPGRGLAGIDPGSPGGLSPAGSGDEL